MTLFAIINDQEYQSLSEIIKCEYKKHDDGRYILEVEQVDGFALEDVSSLKGALNAERTRNQDASARLREWSDIGASAQEIKAAIKQAEELAHLEPEKIQQQIGNIKKALELEHATELAQLENRKQKLTKELEKVMLDQTISKAIADAGGSAPLLFHTIRAMTRFEQTEYGEYEIHVLDNEGNTRISPAFGCTAPMSIEELVSEMKENPVYQPAFAGTQASGMGMRN